MIPGASSEADSGKEDPEAGAGAGEDSEEGGEEEEEEKVVFGPFQAPLEELQFQGGVVKVWWRAPAEDERSACREVSETVLAEDGLMLPQYSDSNAVSYVLEGTRSCF
jgi:hypothetical protein